MQVIKMQTYYTIKDENPTIMKYTDLYVTTTKKQNVSWIKQKKSHHIEISIW